MKQVLAMAVRQAVGRRALIVTLYAAVLLASHPAWSAPAQAQDELLHALIATMTPEERVGQLLLVNFVGSDITPTTPIAKLVREQHIGAVFISASNGNVINSGDTAAQVAALTNGLQQRAHEATARTVLGRAVFLPVLVATDNEGDFYPFTNITHNLTPLPSAMTIGATWERHDAETVGRITGQELGLLGVNLLLGPVVDVLESPRSGGRGDIGTRSFGGNPAWVGALGRAYVRGVHEGSGGRVLTVGKHFPGHGGSDRSTDNEVATVNKTLAELRRAELLPFAALTAHDAADPLGTTDAVMTSHIRYRGFQAVDPFTRPLSLDPQGLQAALALPEFAAWRKDGLMVSDALGVSAVKRWYDPTLQSFPHRQVARDALLAGNDLLALVEFSQERGWAQHQLPNIVDTAQFLAQQYRTDPLLRARIDDALRRVLALKLRLYPDLTLEQVQVAPAAASAGVGRADAAMAALVQDALTLISPSPDELRLRLPRGPQRGETILILECWADCYPYRQLPELDLADTILRSYGPAGTGAVRPADVRTESFGDLQRWLDRTLEPEADQRVTEAVTRADWIVFALTEYNPDSYPSSGAARRFLDAAPLDLRNKKLVALSFHAPYQLDATQIGKLTAYFAVYSKTPQARAVAIKALFRELQPRGASPVSIAGTGYDLGEAVQPAPGQTLNLALASPQPAPNTVTVVTGRILDRKGHPVPDGTELALTVQEEGQPPASRTAITTDGVATATFAVPASAATVTARLGGLRALPLTVAGRGVPAPPVATATTPPEPSAVDPLAPPPAVDGSGAAALPSLVFPAVLGLVGMLLGAVIVARRRAVARRTPPLPPVTVAAAISAPGPAPLPLLEQPAEPPMLPPQPALRIEPDTRRVWVEGNEVRPPLSPEQYRLLAWLHQNAGRVCSREEIVTRVWPEAHTDGVSEEALDALVRRLRERLAQAGGDRRLIVTVRGHGLRLDV